MSQLRDEDYLTCFRQYVGLKQHFATDVDYRYRMNGGKGLTRLTVETLNARNDLKWFIEFTKRHPDKNEREQFLLTGFIDDKNKWIGDFFSQDLILVHKKRMRQYEHLKETVMKELTSVRLFVDTPLCELMQLTQDGRPKLTQYCTPSYETLAVLSLLYGLETHPLSNPLWNKKRHTIKKYSYIIEDCSESLESLKSEILTLDKERDSL